MPGSFDLYRSEFFLETIHQAPSWLLPHPRQLEKIGSLLVKISCMNLQVLQVRGTKHIVADTLSSTFEGYDAQEAVSSTHAV